MTKTEPAEKSLVRRKAVKYLHQEIHNRYELPHLRAIPDIARRNLLAGITQEDIDRLESFFISTIYPDVDRRFERDKSFESLIKLLKRPHKLTAVIPSIPSIMLRYATIFPAALRIGLNTILAYTLSNKLEDKMVDSLYRIYTDRGEKITDNLTVSSKDYHEAYVSVPYGEGKRMIGLASVVMRAGKRKALTASTWEIMNEVQAALRQKDTALKKSGKSPIHEEDIDAIEYGKSVLESVIKTFDLYSEQTMRNITEVSLITETEYLNRMHGLTTSRA